jgi:hypothetical protein
MQRSAETLLTRLCQDEGTSLRLISHSCGCRDFWLFSLWSCMGRKSFEFSPDIGGLLFGFEGKACGH